MKELNEMPSAKIALKRNVLKMYDVAGTKSVFLKDGSEFEIELFNPTQSIILAKIKLNGEFINGGGLILKPGKRVFLERYLDVDKTFKFSTYLVDKNNEQVDNAIKNNGLVEVLFYYNLGTSSTTTYISPNFNYTAKYTDFTTIGSKYFFNQNTPLNLSESETIATCCDNKTDCCTEKETGRIEEGSKSNQPLTNTSMYFSSFPFHKVDIKILPESEKVYDTEDFKYRKYCSECGNKVKPNDKYCSNCGHKL